MKIGFIGLGIMGSRMAANILKGSEGSKELNELCIYNRDKTKACDLIEKGAKFINSPEELAEQVDVVFTMLSTPDVVREVAGLFLSSMRADALWVDCTTVNPAFSKEMAQIATGKNVRFIDAPVAGSLKPAENGELIFLAGGEAADIAEVQPMFDLMGKKTIHVGTHGMGSSMKMVVNLMLGQSLVAFSEAVNLGKAMGVSEDMLLKTLIGSIMTAPFVGLKENNFKTDSYSPEFPLEWMHKDLRLASLTAKEVGAELLSGDVAEQIFEKANESGLSRNDCSAVYKFLQE